jgi:hypothetical protein
MTTGSSDSWLQRPHGPAAEDHAGAVIREYRLARAKNQVAVANAIGITEASPSSI